MMMRKLAGAADDSEGFRIVMRILGWIRAMGGPIIVRILLDYA
jgi:hypothetical protein